MLLELSEAALSMEGIEAVYRAGPAAVDALVSQLVAVIVQPQRQISDLQRQNEELSTRLKALEDRWSKDSHTSSKPPASDGFGRKPKSLRTNTGRKPGGQPGHPGKTLEMSETPDKIVVHSAEACPGCGKDLGAVEVEILDRCQVFEIPPSIASTGSCATGNRPWPSSTTSRSPSLTIRRSGTFV